MGQIGATHPGKGLTLFDHDYDVICGAMETPSHRKFSLERGLFIKEMTGPDFFGPSIIVNAAWDTFGYWVWGVLLRRGVRSRAV